MSELQTFLALVVLIYVLCVIVQGIQEVVKSLLNSKAKVMEQAITEFMGAHLQLDQVKQAMEVRGLKITALERFDQAGFRKLLDGVQFTTEQLQAIPRVVAAENATLDQFKDNIAAAYEGAQAKFQRLYTTYNKRCVIILSFAVVLALNASVTKIYNLLAINQSMSQAIAGTAATIGSGNQGGTTQSQDPNTVYENNRKAIQDQLQKYPVILRTSQYPEDFKSEPVLEIIGLLIMGALVSLGAPFWNDVLKGAAGLNDALNSKKS
jgi:hypothetical protein